MDVMIKENERVDDLDFKGLKIIQDPKSFRFEWMQCPFTFCQTRPGIR